MSETTSTALKTLAKAGKATAKATTKAAYKHKTKLFWFCAGIATIKVVGLFMGDA